MSLKTIAIFLCVSPFACAGPDSANLSDTAADKTAAAEALSVAANKEQAVTIDFDITCDSVPNSIAANPPWDHEFGTAHSDALGDFNWDSMAQDYVDAGLTATNGLETIMHVATSVFVSQANSADTLTAQYKAPSVIQADGSATWTGTWHFVGGTGKFAGIHGSGVIPANANDGMTAAQVQQLLTTGSVTTVYHCEFTGQYKF